MKSIIRTLGIGSLITAYLAVTGCAATSTAISKRELDVQTRTSTAIFVDPVPAAKRTIYVDVKSGVMEFDRRAFKTYLKNQFTLNDNNYKLVDDPTKAQFQMIAYVKNLEKTSPTAAEKALGRGYEGGAVAAGAATGAVIGGPGNRGTGALTGGVVAGGLELIAGAFVKDVTYMLVADVQIKEKAAKGVYVRKDSQTDSKISDSGSSRQTYSEVSNKKEYRTRIVTTANKANLKLAEAQDLMFKKTAYAISGFF